MDIYKKIRYAKKVFIIGEAGVNHNGDLRLARRLIDVAAKAGCDAVKFQTFKAEKLVSRKAPKARYQKETTSTQETQFEMIKKLELDLSAHRELLAYCRKKKIVFLSTPFDEESADLLRGIALPVFKIPSGEVTNLPFLRYVARKKIPIILSTGMSTLKEVHTAVKIIQGAGNARLVLLHCVTAYPAPIEQVNLRAMLTLAQAFRVPVGYSDHTQGVDAALAAVVLGARVIEKHFTLDCSLPGPDHKASLEPQALADLVARVRKIEKAMGTGIKIPAPCEKENMPIARKSVVVIRNMAKGDRISLGDLSIKRPGNGIPPGEIKSLAGRFLIRNVQADDVLRWGDVQC